MDIETDHDKQMAPGEREDETGADIECYKKLVVHLRQINLCLQKQCETPMGEIISLLTIQHMCDEEGQATVTGLGKKLHLSRPAVSRMIHTLKRKEYIEFHHGKIDHRYHYVTLTEEGRGVIRNEMKQIMLTFQDMSARMGKEDMEQFLYYSRKFFSLLPE